MRAGTDAERQRRKGMGDKIADDGSDPDRRQARGRIAADHEFEGVERARQRRAEGARDRSRRAASHHQPLIGTAQMKSAAERSAEPARKLGISGLKPDRCADPAGPDRLQRHDHAAAKRHPTAMQGIGLDRVDFARRPPAQQQQKSYARGETRRGMGTRSARRGSIATWLERRSPALRSNSATWSSSHRGAHGRHHQSADRRRRIAARITRLVSWARTKARSRRGASR